MWPQQSDLGTGGMLGAGGGRKGLETGVGRDPSHRVCQGTGVGRALLKTLSPLCLGKRQDMGTIRFLAHIEIC